MAELEDPFVIIAFPGGQLEDWQPVNATDEKGNMVGLASYATIDAAWDEVSYLQLDNPETEFKVYRLTLADEETPLENQRTLH